MTFNKVVSVLHLLLKVESTFVGAEIPASYVLKDQCVMKINVILNVQITQSCPLLRYASVMVQLVIPQ